MAELWRRQRPHLCVVGSIHACHSLTVYTRALIYIKTMPLPQLSSATIGGESAVQSRQLSVAEIACSH